MRNRFLVSAHCTASDPSVNQTLIQRGQRMYAEAESQHPRPLDAPVLTTPQLTYISQIILHTACQRHPSIWSRCAFLVFQSSGAAGCSAQTEMRQGNASLWSRVDRLAERVGPVGRI